MAVRVASSLAVRRSSRASRRDSRKSPRSNARCAASSGSVTGSGGFLGRGAGAPEALVVVGEHLGAVVVLAPHVDRVVRAVELAQGAAGALLQLDDRDGGRDA